jgi:integrase
MKTRFRLYRRNRTGRYYIHDETTGKQESLHTNSRPEAIRLLHAKNEAVLQPAMNLQIAQVYLQHGDPALSGRTWQQVMEQIISTKKGPTRERWEYAIKDKALDLIRNRKLIQTSSEHFLDVLNIGSVSTNVFLRRTHNYAIGMHWLPWPVLPKLHWPAVQYKEKRAITFAEHQLIINREYNLATRAYYQLLWHLGGSQTDIATLTTEDIDWYDRTIAYQRQKTGVTSLISFGEEVAAILQTLPQLGYLFPALARIHERHRSKLFIKRLATVGISGVSLHSYRYAWAERAMEAGYPERYAMQALGHSSKAIHRAYSRKAHVKLPPLEEYERKIVPLINLSPVSQESTNTMQTAHALSEDAI